MAARSPYRTRQQEELMAYLRSEAGSHHTAAQIRDHFAAQDRAIGTTTIYRQLERFVEEGSVRKYMLETGDCACYEYVEKKGSCSSHFHCKCERCGRLIHLECDELKEIREHLLTHHGFSWDFGRTVFYGICEECRKEEGGEAP